MGEVGEEVVNVDEKRSFLSMFITVGVILFIIGLVVFFIWMVSKFIIKG